MRMIDGNDPRPRHRLKFRLLAGSYGIVRLGAEVPVPAWATKGEFSAVTRAADELSIVCRAENLPEGVQTQHRWTCLKLEGPFAFSQTGVLLAFIEPLSSNRVPIFAVSTYSTDYVFIREDKTKSALDLLHRAGHTLLESGKGK